MDYRLRIADAAAMETLGGRLAACAEAGCVMHLQGELAAGKTTFARGYLRALGHAGAVKSPTFTLVESYALDGRTVHHFDLYRLADARELEFIGIDDYHDGTADLLIEWAGRGAGSAPSADLVITIELEGTARQVCVSGVSETGSKVVSRLSNAT